jgi:hypothetical protein
MDFGIEQDNGQYPSMNSKYPPDKVGGIAVFGHWFACGSYFHTPVLLVVLKSEE